MPSIATLTPNGVSYKMGSAGAAVQQIQLALRQLGYPLSGTGYFGPATDTAVEAFQKRAGLTVDGEVGPTTAAAIDRALGSDLKAVPAIIKSEIALPLWVQAGLKTLGTKETPGSKDTATIINWAKDEGGDIAKSYTHDSIPWCALWANHILTKAGRKGTETLWALDFNSDLMKQRVGHGWPASKLAGIAVGAFAPMLRDGGGHIGVVMGRDQHGNVMIMGGNQSDAVNIKPFAVSRLNKGFWWPEGEPLPKTGFANLPIVNSSGRVSSNEA